MELSQTHLQQTQEPYLEVMFAKLLATSSLGKSQVMHQIFAFLNKGHVIQLQITCKFWYQSLIPESLFNDVKVGQKAMFLELQTKTGYVSELHIDQHFKNG